MTPRPVIFLGTPDAAVTVLDAIVAAGHPVPLVISRADARRGRGGALSPSPVKARALELGLRVSDDLDELRTMDLPHGCVGVVVAYGRIIPPAVLDRLEMLNVHFSLLPRWRGAAPVERAILAGDKETGVCIMRMEEGLDTGPVFARGSLEISDTVSAAELTAELADLGARLMCEVLGGLPGDPTPQSGEDTYARKLGAAEAIIDWSTDAQCVLRQVRALPASTVFQGKRLRIVRAHASEAELGPGVMDGNGNVGTGDGSIRIVRVQPEGKQQMDALDWLRGLKCGFPALLGQVP